MHSLSSWLLDIRLGLRMLLKYPGLALSGGAGMAVAVAIAAGGFSVIQNNFLASSLPLEEGSRVVSLELWDVSRQAPERRVLYDFEVWREILRSVQEISAFQPLTRNLIEPGRPPESVRIAAMTASGFGVGRVAPLMGRVFTAEDEGPNAAPVVLIGETVWRGRYGGDPGIVGRRIQLGRTSHTVVGVMPGGFAFPVNHRYWMPLRLSGAAADADGARPGPSGSASPLRASRPLTGPELNVFGRLAPGYTIEAARAELAAFGARVRHSDPTPGAANADGEHARMRPLVSPYALPALNVHGDEDIAGILAMQGAVIVLLVLVCLNVAILVYTRTAMRQEEIGLRTALGASRARIIGQLFLESLVLAVAASAAGVGIAALALQYVSAATRNMRLDLPYWISFRLTPEAVAYAGVLGVLGAVVIGVLPGVQATRRRVSAGFRIVGSGETGMRLGRTWTVLIVAQSGFAVALLPGALEIAWKSVRSGLAEPGFAAREFLSAQAGIDERNEVRMDELKRRLEADPRIAGVTYALTDPGDERGARIEVEGLPGAQGTSARLDIRYNLVDPAFFRAFAVPVLAGRGFQPGDAGAMSKDNRGGRPDEGSPVLVNQSLALRAFDGSAVGRRVRYVRDPQPGEAEQQGPGNWHEIVGVVADFPAGVSPGMSDSALKIYHAEHLGNLRPARLAMRIRGGDGAGFEQALRELSVGVDAGIQLRNVRGMDEALRSEQWIRRTEAGVLLAVALSVLLLSSVGIYSLMSFTVAQRHREIGIRMALGASAPRIVTAIFSRASLQVGAGALLGAAVGIASARMAGPARSVGGADESMGGWLVAAVIATVMLIGMAAAWVRRCEA